MVIFDFCSDLYEVIPAEELKSKTLWHNEEYRNN